MEAYSEELTADNISDIIADYDIVVDCLDNYRSRYLINDACALAWKPVVFGAVYQFEGQVSVFDAKNGACFRCQYPSPPPAGLVPTCASGGVISPLPGIIGSIQANEASMLLEDVLYNLSKQISIVLKYLPEHSGKTEDELLSAAEQITLKFLDRLTTVRELIQTDLQAAFDGDPAAFNKPEIIFSYPGLFAIMVNRIAHELYLLGVPLIPRMMTEYAHTQT